MRIVLNAVTKGRSDRALAATSLSYESGTATLVCAETEQRPTVLGLIASGRMRPDSGTVTIDGAVDAGAIRRTIALVDALDVSEPEANVSVAGIVAEELMFAGLPSNPFAARRWLDRYALGALASTPIGNIEPGERIRLLCELAVLRPGVAGMVLTSPDRHGGEPAVWWSIAQDFADRGLAVLVIAGRASQALVDLRDSAGADLVAPAQSRKSTDEEALAPAWVDADSATKPVPDLQSLVDLRDFAGADLVAPAQSRKSTDEGAAEEADEGAAEAEAGATPHEAEAGATPREAASDEAEKDEAAREEDLHEDKGRQP